MSENKSSSSMSTPLGLRTPQHTSHVTESKNNGCTRIPPSIRVLERVPHVHQPIVDNTPIARVLFGTTRTDATPSVFGPL